ncbi:reverse transcriptase [Trichonephila clavipes]|nr:reverse transcriptase [Trichonephila clavipes]
MAKFPEGTIDSDTTYLHLHNFCMELKGRKIFSSPSAGDSAHKTSNPLILRARNPCVVGGYLVASDIEPRPYCVDSDALSTKLPMALHSIAVLNWQPCNERANRKVNQRAESPQQVVSLTLRRAKSIISTRIDKYTAMTQNTKRLGKPWETLAAVDPIPRRLERAEDVTSFRLTSEHDFYWFGLAADEACPLCGHSRMDDEHLFQCSGLDEYPTDDVVSRYWEARHQIVKTPRTDIG